MKFVAWILPVILVVAGAISMHLWLSGDAAEGLEARLPGADGRAAGGAAQQEPARIEGQLVKSDGVPADLPGAWPRFRGSNFDGISVEGVELDRSWGEGGPAVLWSVDVGEGYAAAAVLAGRVYLIDYDHENLSDSIRCLSLADGREIWRYSYPVKVKRWHGMSRGIPAVTDKYIVSMGPKCHVTCLDSQTGELRWMLDLVREFGSKVPQWYAAQCPLIEEGKAIIAPAGEILMMAVDCESGQIVWQTPNTDRWVMTHSSIVPMEFGGKRFYIYCGGDQNRGGVVGVSAEDGEVLWKYEGWKLRFNIPSPVVVGPDRIFLSAGYSQVENGCSMLRLEQSDGKIVVEPEFVHPTDVFGSIQQTPILYEGYIYGVRPDGQLVCLDLAGNVVWTSPSEKKFGSGPYVIANGLMYIMDDSGTLTLVRPGASGYVELARAKVMDGHEAWGPMAVASGRLIVRDMYKMLCLDIAKH